MIKTLMVAAAFALIPLHGTAQEPALSPGREAGAARTLDAVRSDPVRLRAFLEAMPKGADLHNHADGAVYAEALIGMGLADKLCVNSTFVSSDPPCDATKGQQTIESAVQQGAWDKIVDAWSTRNVAKYPISGHDQFFSTFGKFGAAGRNHQGEIVADALRQADRDHVAYVELMATFGSDAARKVASNLHYTGDLLKLNADVAAAGLGDDVSAAVAEVQATDASARKTLGCDSDAHAAGCAVEYRYIAQINRVLPVESVFAQTAIAFGLAKRTPRVVAINYVAPEDNPVAIRDYTLHMHIIRLLSDANPAVNISLHAGELTLGLVPRSALNDHIGEAVDIARAKRIGHGVDIVYERDRDRTLAEMHSRHVLVEINLTSNDVILGVSGKRHPITLYLRSGVPIALSTDDEGVSRIDLTHEYQRAVESYGFSYGQLKTFVRNSLEYSFLPGSSLWKNPNYGMMTAPCSGANPMVVPQPLCSAFLAHNAKAREQWHVENQLAAFEASRR